ncbi:disease resistance protein Pik-2 isoform X2 [Triticum aestivum]|uniref:disease resistance protein Pik-2 isoform X2 n=1 Tax=Triticum aestivum TaxID=4565 RepID=UPI001D011584|nr:disease resistance protein Pik-2-like isoform X2 [Triticum aestivum]
MSMRTRGTFTRAPPSPPPASPLSFSSRLAACTARRDSRPPRPHLLSPVWVFGEARTPTFCFDLQAKLWAHEVRELSYNMEDVVDKFLIRVDNDGIQQPHDNSSRFKELKNKIIGLFKKGKNHHRIADAIKEIKEQVQEVAARRDKNKVVVPNPTVPIAIDPCLRALYVEATELVGIYGKRDREVMGLLSMEGDNASKKRAKKVSIVGFGGLGKTTLARAVYEKIKGDFDCRAFVPVSRNPDIKKVFRDIPVDFDNSHSHLGIMDEKQLIDKLREFLENKRQRLAKWNAEAPTDGQQQIGHMESNLITCTLLESEADKGSVASAEEE